MRESYPPAGSARTQVPVVASSGRPAPLQRQEQTSIECACLERVASGVFPKTERLQCKAGHNVHGFTSRGRREHCAGNAAVARDLRAPHVDPRWRPERAQTGAFRPRTPFDEARRPAWRARCNGATVQRCNGARVRCELERAASECSRERASAGAPQHARPRLRELAEAEALQDGLAGGQRVDTHVANPDR
jgi:hypothetical protein